MNHIPQDIEDALENAGLAEFFADCTPAHQKEYLQWIDDAKRAETRSKRIAQAMPMIAAKWAEEKARAKKRA
jgi:uncharacterized protein YdeI (YjbR/CyaY-like superfamily)